MKIYANASGTRTIEVSEKHLATIRKYSLFERIANSAGIVDEESLAKLRYTVRSLIVSQHDDTDALVGLCWVLFDDNMKALGLNNLIKSYYEWFTSQQSVTTQSTEESDNGI